MKGHNMFSLRNKKLSLNYPQYPCLYGALDRTTFANFLQKKKTNKWCDFKQSYLDI